MAAGFLFPKRYEVLYQEALDEPDSGAPPVRRIYGLPRPDEAPGANHPCYRGIDRRPLSALSLDHEEWFNQSGYPNLASEASNLLWEIEERTGRDDGWLTMLADACEVWRRLGGQQPQYELIFGREHGDATPTPVGAQFRGCDAAYFAGDHFSCICDALFFPRWHGTDEAGVLFLDHYRRLNPNGLFDSHEHARAYLDYYLSFDWTERSEAFTTIEVYSVAPE